MQHIRSWSLCATGYESLPITIRESLLRWPRRQRGIIIRTIACKQKSRAKLVYLTYSLLQPYGRIVDITPPQPVPPGALRSALVSFRHIRSAAIARNTIHGLAIPSDSGGATRLRTSYQVPIQAHVIRDYVASHPRIFLPIFFFILGSLTYTVRAPSLSREYDSDQRIGL